MRHKAKLWGINAEPPVRLVWLYRLAPFVVFLLLYELVSTVYLSQDPNGKIYPSFASMVSRIWNLAFTLDSRTGSYLLWVDTWASLYRIGYGIGLAAIAGFVMGLNIAIFPGLREISLPLVIAASSIPTMAVLPVLLIVMGIGEGAKIGLIFLGLVFIFTRDTCTTTQAIPQELMVKARTLGVSQIGLVYRVAAPMIFPRLLVAIQQSVGLAWLFLIASEGIAATEGLGYRIFLVRRYLDNAAIFPYVIWIGFLAFLMNFACTMLHRWLCPWVEKPTV